MLTAKPIQSKEDQKALAQACSFPYRPDHFAYGQKENDRYIAGIQFDIDKDGGIISDMAMVDGMEDDTEALFILGRAVMNFLELQGNQYCRYLVHDEQSRKMAILLGFKEKDSWSLDLRGLFDHPCSHGNGFQR